MKTYKGFDKDLKCRGFQYEIGKEYETEKAKACECGFHACVNPFDVFNYYAPSDSRFCEVEQSGDIDTHGDDSKIASTKIKVCAEIGLSGIIKAGVKFILDRVNHEDSPTNTGNQSAATNTSYRSAATNTGYRSVATNTGDQSVATNTGYRSVTTNTGDQSAATNTSYRSAATNTGDQSVATNTGYQSVATNTGNRSVATNTGYQSAATNTGNRSVATNTGYQSVATNTGYQSAAIVGNEGSVAVAVGYESKAKAGIGSAIVVVERGEWNGCTFPLIGIKSAIVDGKTIKADTFYTLKNGEFVEC